MYGEEERPFEIKSCNTLVEDDGSAAGCNVLSSLLSSVRPDSPQVMIGLFDRDYEGIKAFSLNKNFVEKEDGWKQHKNKKANGLLLPIPSGKELFAQYNNLCIEFYFEKSDIDQKIEGKGLILISPRGEMKFNGVPVNVDLPNEMHLQKIDSNTKSDFAETVVPTLPVASFVHFRGLFQKILQILEIDHQMEI